MDVTKLSVEELFKSISPNSAVHQELRSRNVIRTKNLVGDIGEYYVKKFLIIPQIFQI